MKQSRFPKGWNADRVERVLAHYESQSEEEAIAEDEAAWEDSSQTFTEVPHDFVPPVRELIRQKSGESRVQDNQEEFRGVASG